MKQIFTMLTLMLISLIGQAQDKKDKWDVSNPTLPFTETTITTDEGTWMSLDVSPDGQTIVFDMLGDIYAMNIAGGKAKLLREGHAFEVQPRFSPDGSHISFTSDAGGGDNIWVMNSDGSNPKQVTKENFRLTNNAVWTVDGNYIICRKHFSSTRSLGAGEIWMYHISGGKGIQLTKKKNDQQDVGEPWTSADGKYVYYSEDVYPGGYFKYNKDPNNQIYVINRYDLESGEIDRITGGPGGAIRPVTSRNGKYLAFVRRVREKTVLFVHDLSSGKEWPIYDQLSKDQQEAWAIFGPYVGFNWMPDDGSIVIWNKGKIISIDIKNGTATNIPFEAESTHKIVDALKFNNKVAPDTFTAKAIRHAVTSPDGNTLIFNAAGFLWKKELPNGTPKRLTNGSDFEFEPQFSKNGNSLIYVTWNDITMGAIMQLDLTSSKAKPRQLTTEKGIYRTPSFSPVSSSTILYQKSYGNGHMGYAYSNNPGIYTLQVSSSKKTINQPVLVTKDGSYPSFNADGKRIYFQAGGYLFGELTKKLMSVKMDGTDEKEHVNSKYANRIIPSPNDEWVAFSNLHKVYIAAMPKSGKALNIDGSATNVPVAQVAKDAGISLQWSANSSKINWTLGDEYFSNDINQRFQFLAGAPDSIPAMDTTGVKINLQLKTDKPKGKIAFTHATIITMKGEEVIEDGTIIVEGNKILNLGKNIEIPEGTKTIDATGKTIMPGLIDVHAHLGQFRYGLSPQQHWQYQTNLAYGVTTTHDPSSNTEMVFSQSEMVKAGNMVGPRIFSTGIILYGADGDFKAVVNNVEDAKSAIRRTKAFGAFSVKSYNQPRREQRQQIIQAAHQYNMEVVPEGGSTFYHNLSMILDGHTGIEHNIPIETIYDDVIQLWSSSKTQYTPTLIVNYGSVNGEYYWYQNTNVWEDEKLMKFTPRSIIDSRSRHRTMIPNSEYENGHILTSKSCTKLADAGVKINLGAHGQIQGIGVHWELWMLSQGGMTNHQALATATTNGAEYLGMTEEIGSLEVGKLADLILLDKNPLDDIQNSNSVSHTMINGRLYDTNTLNEIGNSTAPRKQFYWERDGYNSSFDWHEASKVGCSCETKH